nr:hypothetical protein CFP56_09318 [Quercus suber]
MNGVHCSARPRQSVGLEHGALSVSRWKFDLILVLTAERTDCKALESAPSDSFSFAIIGNTTILHYLCRGFRSIGRLRLAEYRRFRNTYVIMKQSSPDPAYHDHARLLTYFNSYTPGHRVCSDTSEIAKFPCLT